MKTRLKYVCTILHCLFSNKIFVCLEEDYVCCNGDETGPFREDFLKPLLEFIFFIKSA